MKVAAFFQIFWAAATINLGLVIAAPRGSLQNGLSKRTTTHFCDSTAEEVITYSLGEMIDMVYHLSSDSSVIVPVTTFIDKHHLTS